MKSASNATANGTASGGVIGSRTGFTKPAAPSTAASRVAAARAAAKAAPRPAAGAAVKTGRVKEPAAVGGHTTDAAAVHEAEVLATTEQQPAAEKMMGDSSPVDAATVEEPTTGPELGSGPTTTEEPAATMATEA